MDFEKPNFGNRVFLSETQTKETTLISPVFVDQQMETPLKLLITVALALFTVFMLTIFTLVVRHFWGSLKQQLHQAK
jgi:hypothetical protein